MLAGYLFLKAEFFRVKQDFVPYRLYDIGNWAQIGSVVSFPAFPLCGPWFASHLRPEQAYRTSKMRVGFYRRVGVCVGFL